jgi:hypothetical protein
MKIPEHYNYKPYLHPKKGLFSVETGYYNLKDGWIQKSVETVIIGEPNLHYIEQLQEYEFGEWVGNTVIKNKIITPIGIHKSRLIKWLTVQLELEFCL